MPYGLVALLALAGCGFRSAEEPEGQLPPDLVVSEPAPDVVVPAAMRATEGELQSLPDVAERVVKSVVSVSTERAVDPRTRRGFTFGSPVEKGLGSGVILEDGVIVTNNHVVAGAEQVVVTLDDGTEVPAKVVGTDPKSDIAVLRLVDPPDGLVALPYGDSNALRLGEPVLAVGNPFGVGQTVTLGIVSALGRSKMGILDYEDFIQTDAAINPGNSGGALVDLRGRLVGVNTAIVSRSGGSQGIGFAIPEQMVRYVVGEILEDGRVDRGFLGVAIEDVAPAMRKTLGVQSPGGALISGVAARSPAAEAGFEVGDVVLTFDGAPVADATRFRNAVAATGPDRPFAAEVLREGSTVELRGTLGELPPDEAQLPSGVRVVPR